VNLSFFVFALKARVEQEYGGNQTVAVRFQEFGTHHAFVARFRDPVLFIEMVAEMQDLIKKKGWDVNPPKRQQDLQMDKGHAETQPRQVPEAGAGDAPTSEDFVPPGGGMG